MKYLLTVILIFYLLPSFAGNQTITSFNKAKKLLKNIVYANHHQTFYCHASFDEDNNLILPKDFLIKTHEQRAHKLEWEHVVPAEHFGKAFEEWRTGHPKCIDKNGKYFKGRKCTEKINTEFRFMLCDLYNLYPAIGSVNAIRNNFNYTELPDITSTFGSCPIKVHNDQIEPPIYTRGAIARTYLYFEKEYPRYQMNDTTSKLMHTWDKMYPVDEWECQRAHKIETLQGNPNFFIKIPCQQKGLYE